MCVCCNYIYIGYIVIHIYCTYYIYVYTLLQYILYIIYVVTIYTIYMYIYCSKDFFKKEKKQGLP